MIRISAININCATTSANKQTARSDVEEKNIDSIDTCEMPVDISSLQVSENPGETREKKSNCRFCAGEFTHISYLDRHRAKIHTDKSPYMCSDCHKSFLTWTPLAQHEKTHTDKKPYHCNICLQKFSKVYSLIQHKMLTHTGEKLYQCGEFSQKFL